MRPVAVGAKILSVRLERYDEAPRVPRRTWLHPVSALAILGIDWLFFAEEVVTFEVALPIACVLAFVTAGSSVYLIQRRKSSDSRGNAMGKALFGAFIAGIPTSISGTILGTVVLMLAGLRGAKRNDEPPKKANAP